MVRSAWFVRFALLLLVLVPFGGPARAQDRVWLQIEAQPSLLRAEERARTWATLFPDVAGYRLTSGWYALVLGPYGVEAGAARLADLRRENLVPADSFVSDGGNFLDSFWPVGPIAPSPLPGDLALNEDGSLPGIDPLAPAAPEAVTPIAPLDPLTTTPLPANPLAENPSVEAPLAEAPLPDVVPPQAALPLPQQPGPIAPVFPSVPDETPAQARRSEDDLTRGDREALQTALQWFGFYTAEIDGQFGPGTRASMADWQVANAQEPTGILTTGQRASLIGAWREAQAELGLRTVTETAAGIEIAIPTALVQFDHYEPPFVHFTEKDGSGVSVILISQPGDQSALFGLYDVLQTLEIMPTTGERSRGETSFKMTGRSDARASHAFAELGGGLIKGYVLSWNPADDDRMARVEAAMAASFRAIGAAALDPGLVPMEEAGRRGLLAGLEVRRPVRSRSGFYVSTSGAVLTATEAVEGCARLTIDRDVEAAVSFVDQGQGVALLTPATPLSPPEVASFASGPDRIGSEIAVSGYSYEDTLPAPVLTFGILEDDTGLDGEVDMIRLTLKALPGDVGGPVLGSDGAVRGMLLARASNAARVLPADVALAADAPGLTALLAAQGVTAAQAGAAAPLPPDDLARQASGMTVLVSCWD